MVAGELKSDPLHSKGTPTWLLFYISATVTAFNYALYVIWNKHVFHKD